MMCLSGAPLVADGWRCSVDSARQEREEIGGQRRRDGGMGWGGFCADIIIDSSGGKYLAALTITELIPAVWMKISLPFANDAMNMLRTLMGPCLYPNQMLRKAALCM